MAVDFPVGIPNPTVTGYSFQNETHTRSNDVITGPPRVELLSESRPTYYNVTWALNQNQFNVFEGWFKWVTAFGSKSFNLDMYVGEGLKTHECYFRNGTYNSSLIGRRWTITTTLFAVIKPVIDQCDYEELAAILSLPCNSNNLKGFYAQLINFAEVTLPDYWENLKYGTDYSGNVPPPVALTFDPLTANNVILSNSNQTAQSNYTVPSGPFGTPVNVDSEEFPVLQERTISINIDAYNGLGNTPATSIAILGLYSVVSGIGVESGITFLSDGSLITEGTFNVSGVNPLFGALPTIVLGQATTYEGLIVIKPSGNVYIGLSIGGAAPVYLSWDGVSGSIPQLDGDPVNDLNPTFTIPDNTEQYFYQVGATQQAGQPVVTWQVTADFDS